MRSGRVDPCVLGGARRLHGVLARALLCAVLPSVACSASKSAAPPPDTAQLAVTDATTRLEGQWVLVDFQPDSPLEPMLASYLAAQMNQLQVSFHGGTMKVEGVGVSAARSYRVTQAAADGFALTVVDPTNVEYRANGAFQANVLHFTSLSDPWRGHGRLQRSP